jgi:hypothetical protein
MNVIPRDDLGRKRCGHCLNYRDPREFATNKQTRDGLSPVCKLCDKDRRLSIKEKSKNVHWTPIQEAQFAENFWAKVRKTDGCWEWTGGCHELGYGRCWYKLRVVPAHVASYLIAGKTIKDGEEIDHLCRNPKCVRPDHLEAVSHTINVQRGDAAKEKAYCKRGHPMEGRNIIHSEGRRMCRSCAYMRNRLFKQRKAAERAPRLPRVGERSPYHKLTEDKVREIRRLYSSGMTQASIGKKFSIGQATTNHIVRRILWSHVG